MLAYSVLGVFCVSLIITLLIIPIICTFSDRFGLLDRPDGHIKTHTKAIPNLGGLAVYMGFFIALVMAMGRALPVMLIGATVLLIVGLIDDRRPLKPYQKFFGQLIAGFCFLGTGFCIKSPLLPGYLNYGFSLLWIATVVNAFNLVDVMDGLASSVALCATAILLSFAWYMHNTDVFLLLIALAGALIGFLWYNKPPASVYLGDAGALLIGGVLSCVVFLYPWSAYNQYGFLIPVVVLALPLLEVATLICVRTYKGIPFYKASPDHFCLILLRKGWSKNQVLVYVAGASAVLCGASWLFLLGALSKGGYALSGVIFLALWFLVLL